MKTIVKISEGDFRWADVLENFWSLIFFSSKHISSRNLFHNITEYVHSGIKDGGDKK